MPTSEIAERFLRGEEVPLAVNQIATDLSRLWQAAPVAHDFKSTLLVRMSNPALIDQISATLRAFAQSQSCRILLLVLNPHSEQEELIATATAIIAAPVASEQVLLLVSGASVARVADLAAPLVLTDAPLVCWFAQGIPEETPLLARWLNKAPQIIFDSLSAEDLGLTLARANALHESTSRLVDLNWQRLAPWLSVLDEIFTKPETASSLAGIEKISFLVGGEVLDENQISQPVLLLSWLAQRLGWELVETFDYAQGAFRGVWEKDGREFGTEIKNTNAATTELRALSINARAGEEQIVLSIARAESEAGEVLQAKLSRGAQEMELSKRVIGAIPTISDLLLGKLESQAFESNYQTTLALATKLI